MQIPRPRSLRVGSLALRSTQPRTLHPSAEDGFLLRRRCARPPRTASTTTLSQRELFCTEFYFRLADTTDRHNSPGEDHRRTQFLACNDPRIGKLKSWNARISRKDRELRFQLPNSTRVLGQPNTEDHQPLWSYWQALALASRQLPSQEIRFAHVAIPGFYRRSCPHYPHFQAGVVTLRMENFQMPNFGPEPVDFKLGHYPACHQVDSSSIEERFLAVLSNVLVSAQALCSAVQEENDGNGSSIRIGIEERFFTSERYQPYVEFYVGNARQAAYVYRAAPSA